MSSSTSGSGPSHTLLDTLVADALNAKDDVALNNLLKNYASRETREITFASLLSGGQDPLLLLDPRKNTLAFLYLL